jgi:hypothetical protein
MSRSYHVTYKDIKNLSVKGLEEAAANPNSVFRMWAKKLGVKNSVLKIRKQKQKEKKSANEYSIYL